MVKGLVAADAARIVAVRMMTDFDSVNDMWRLSGVPAEAPVQLVEVDAFRRTPELKRRDAFRYQSA
jgi:error-prone DNA polymerase